MKDFDNWNKLKKKINTKEKLFIPRDGEVCLCSIGLNIGFESDGKNKEYLRPVLILKSYGKSGAIILPLTTKNKSNIFHFKISEKSFVKLTQIRFIDLRRLKRKISKIDNQILEIIRNKLFSLL